MCKQADLVRIQPISRNGEKIFLSLRKVNSFEERKWRNRMVEAVARLEEPVKLRQNDADISENVP